jgi:hypothetical protein
MAHAWAVEMVVDCLVRNKQRLQEAEAVAAQLSAAGHEHAARTLALAKQENERQLEQVRREAESRVAAVRTRMEAIGVTDLPKPPQF